MADQIGGGPPPYLDLLRPRPTGNVIATLRDEPEAAQLRTLARGARRSRDDASIVAHSLSCLEIGALDLARIEEPILLRGYGVALMPSGPSGASRDAQRLLAEEAEIEEARPEFYMYAVFPPASDTPERTWGVAAVGAEAGRFTGRGMRIAVLDTGFDLGHPDFEGRRITARSFVAGVAADDVQGHGTHCAGTAAGPRAGGNRPRYGVAPEADLYIGKVLDDGGRGQEIDILAGMAWAVQEGCEIISMSLGRPVQPGEKPSRAYERLGARALEAGSLIVAAAGNDSSRQFGFIAPVGAPANSVSILAVAAADSAGKVADFSSGAINPDGGGVDIAGPGVDVFSAFPRPQLYRALQGTSMACPHVAGCAALWAESDPSLRGRALWEALTRAALPLGQPARDLGAGLVQAPPPTAAA